MRLEVVDVFFFTADNIVLTVLVRSLRHPPVRELGEVDEKYIIGTAEVLSLPQIKRYGNRIKEMRQESKRVTGSPTQP